MFSCRIKVRYLITSVTCNEQTCLWVYFSTVPHFPFLLISLYPSHCHHNYHLWIIFVVVKKDDVENVWNVVQIVLIFRWYFQLFLIEIHWIIYLFKYGLFLYVVKNISPVCWFLWFCRMQCIDFWVCTYQYLWGTLYAWCKWLWWSRVSMKSTSFSYYLLLSYCTILQCGGGYQ
jgi:hypothetical protein